jgi:hypothetical protein
MGQQVEPLFIRTNKAKRAVFLTQAAEKTFIAIALKITEETVVGLKVIHSGKIPAHKHNHEHDNDCE